MKKMTTKKSSNIIGKGLKCQFLERNTYEKMIGITNIHGNAKLHWHSTSSLLVWLLSDCQNVSNAGNYVVKWELSHTISGTGNANQCNYYGKEYEDFSWH